MALPSYKYGVPATTWKKIYVLEPYTGVLPYNCSEPEIGREFYISDENRVWIRDNKSFIDWFVTTQSGARSESIKDGEVFEALEKAREIALREKKLKRILDEI